MDIVRSVLDNLHFDAAVFFAQLALFYTLHLLLTPILYKPLAKAQRERSALTSERIDEAERINAQALKLKNQYEQAIRQTQKEALAITQTARQKADADRQAVLDAARNEANEIIKKARADMAKERQDAQKELTAELPSLAQAVAVKIAKALISGEVSERYIKRMRGVS